MMQKSHKRPKPAWLRMAGLGLVTGVLSAVTFALKGEGWVSGFRGLSPGLWYGVVLAVYLAVTSRAGIGRAAAFAALITGFWYAALMGALKTPDILGLAPMETGELLPGLVGGVIGGAGMAATSALLFPPVRRVRHWAVIWALGSAAGLLFAVQSMFVLFCAWQAVVGGALGYALSEPRAEVAPATA